MELAFRLSGKAGEVRRFALANGPLAASFRTRDRRAGRFGVTGLIKF